jgi:tetratricopeptide (TPR) repeat protein
MEKPMTETPDLSADEAFQCGANAYAEQNFKKAIGAFLSLIEKEPRHWQGRLFLAMAYFQAGDLLLAQAQFRFLQQHSSDFDIRQKAEMALKAVSSAIANTPQNILGQNNSLNKLSKGNEFNLDEYDQSDLELMETPVCKNL